MNKKLKSGYTTGSTAAAACKIAVFTLFTKTKVEKISIDTPKGLTLNILANYLSCLPNKVTSFVIKDHSDDPDVTRGLKIYAEAVESQEEGIIIKTGEGIGIVTKKGLRVPVGKPAINPVPYKMILDEISKVLPKGKGVVVTLYIPDGVEIAKKTFNAKLGIIGGLSILGTTGIVEPMSESAFKASLKIEMAVSLEENPNKDMVFVFGNYGLDHIRKYNLHDSKIQKTSNFIAYMVNAASELGVKKLLLVGHAGKMVKVAYGMENTHSKNGDNRMKSIAQSCSETSVKDYILSCNTTDEAVEFLKEHKLAKDVFIDINNRSIKNLQKWSNNKIEIESLIFTTEFGEIVESPGVQNMLKEMIS